MNNPRTIAQELVFDWFDDNNPQNDDLNDLIERIADAIQDAEELSLKRPILIDRKIVKNK